MVYEKRKKGMVRGEKEGRDGEKRERRKRG